MNVHLSFDVEIWCDGWDHLDQAFPACYERYVFGRSGEGEYALPKTLEILNQHGLHGVFFVEALFAARFGIVYLKRIVDLIQGAGHTVQLHLHPEWTDEILPPIVGDVSRKRQHMTYYTLDEQTLLIRKGLDLLGAAGSRPVTAFRAGSFAANADTLEALSRNGIFIDSSLNRCFAVSGPDLRKRHGFDVPFDAGAVRTFPVSVFTDGLGRDRPAQIGACSFEEMRDALDGACDHGHQDFVIVSHCFELLRPGTTLPDRIVVGRFEQLCGFLASERARMPTTPYPEPAVWTPLLCTTADQWQPRVSLLATVRRYVEQALRYVS
jgi:peptidoglycan/xylan/chitin deacetylase (PgdA/CDA1 family)